MSFFEQEQEEGKIRYTKVDNLRFRETPNTEELENVIRELDKGAELEIVSGPWIKVRINGKVGWVHKDYTSREKPTKTRKEASKSENELDLQAGVPNLAHDKNTKIIREAIDDEFGGGVNGWSLQCTEYVQYKVQEVLGVQIQWPVSSGRHGGEWASIFEEHDVYKVQSKPKRHCAASFTKINPPHGHLAFVEEVLGDGKIRVSEANWPSRGKYNERIITKRKQKEKYGIRFVIF